MDNGNERRSQQARLSITSMKKRKYKDASPERIIFQVFLFSPTDGRTFSFTYNHRIYTTPSVPLISAGAVVIIDGTT